MVGLYKGEEYPPDLRMSVEQKSQLTIEIANRWMLGWPNLVRRLIAQGEYLPALVSQEQEERRALSNPGCSHLAQHEIVQEYGLSLSPPSPSPDKRDHEETKVVAPRSTMRLENLEYSIDDLIDASEAHFLLRDDTDPEFLARRAATNQRLRQLIGYESFHALFKHPRPTVPENPAWVTGEGETPEYKWLKMNFPGIVEYFVWAQRYPQATFWTYVARLGHWQLLEDQLTAAMKNQSRIAAWEDVHMALLRRAKKDHAARVMWQN
jgi:hypothetical protein